MNQLWPSSVPSAWYMNPQHWLWNRFVHMNICVFMRIYKDYMYISQLLRDMDINGLCDHKNK